MNEKVLLMEHGPIPDSLKTFVYRHLRKRRWDERKFAEQQTTKHRFEARKSCVSDARNYRIAREFPISAIARLDWSAIISRRRSNMFGSTWFKKFRDDHLKRWLPGKWAG
jgi:hypothetical protein